MKICRCIYESETRHALFRNGGYYLIQRSWKIGSHLADPSEDDRLDPKNVRFLPPFEPGKIVCVGRNYAKHAEELGNDIPSEPLLFLKAPSAVISEGESIMIPDQSEQVEHEGELGVVIGRECRKIGLDEDPLNYVFGFVCLNDVTARDLQRKDVQFTRAKSFDTFCPISRFVETEADLSDLQITTIVNGIIRQEGRTSEMVFDIPFLIRYISDNMTLKTGDLVATGTPAGVSRLLPGDVCEIEVETVGRLSNPVGE